MRIAFRADASPSIGGGHVMRCLALAQELKARGDEVGFFSRDLPPSYAGTVREAGAELFGEELRESPWDWLVVDHYQLDASWERAQRASARRILAIDDLANRTHDCDLLLDQNILGAGNPYAKLVPEKARVCLGPRYALLRPAFAAARKTLGQRSGAVRRVFICFGGGDPANHTAAALKALEPHAGRVQSIDVVVGPASRFRHEVETLAKKIAQAKMQLGGEIAGLLANADLAIGAGGSMAWERACLGVPTLAFGIAANQEPVLAALFEAGCAVGERSMARPDEAKMAAWVSKVIGDAALLRGLGAKSRQLVDGQGARRIADRMHGAALRFRRATAADSDNILSWRNDPQVRLRSLDPGVIDASTHAAWMQRVLADPKRVLLIAEDSAAPVGVVRFDLDGADARISVYRTPAAMQGSRGLIREATAWLRHNHPEVATVTAEVRADNAASAAAFRAAGYTPWQDLLRCRLR